MNATSVRPIELLAACGVVPVIALPDPELAVPLARTLAEAGLPALEVTLRTVGAAKAIRAISTAVPEVTVGAGTVLTVDQVAEALDAGASFLVTPGTNPAVVEAALARGAVILPGIATPSEIEANLARGLDVLKFFPAEAMGGRRFLRAVHGPYRSVRFVPSGGVTAANLRDYLAEPNVLACGGTWIASARTLEAGDLRTVAVTAREAAAIVAEVRSPSVPVAVTPG